MLVSNLCRQDTFYHDLSIFSSPDISALVIPMNGTCANDSILFFLNENTNPLFDIDWNFGDGYYPDLLSPVHRFEIPGDHEIILTVTNPEGCSSQYFFPVTNGGYYGYDMVLAKFGNNYYLQTTTKATDALIIMMNESFSPLWITPFGGNGADWGHEIHVSNDKLYTGGLASKYPGTTGETNEFPLEDLGEALANDAYYQCDWGDIQTVYGNFIARFQTDFLTNTSDDRYLTKNEIAVYPNPSNGLLTLCWNTQINDNLEINILNILGAVVKKESIKTSSSNCIDMDLQMLPKGTYFINLSYHEQQLTTKIILH